MANSLLTISTITRESLRVLENNLTFTKYVNRGYDDQFAQSGAKIGNTVNIRKPARYIGRTGTTISIENQVETSVPLTLSTQFGVDLQFTSADRLLSLDDFSERVLQPAMATIANKIDNDGLAQALNIYNAVGTPGTTPATLQTYLDANAKLDFMACPRDGLRSVVMDPNANSKLVGALTTLFNPVSDVSKQYKTGNMGAAIGNKFSMDQNINSYTVGPLGGTPLVTSSPAAGATTLVTKGWTSAAASRLNVGDVFTIGAVNSVNPQSRKSTGQLQQFVVTAAFSSDGSGNGSVSVSPAFNASGQFQNIDALPLANAAITVLGNAVTGTVSPMNMVFHRDAFVFGCADLPLPKGVHEADRIADKELGLSARMVSAYDVTNDLFVTRFDVLYGWSTIYPELACRIQG